MQKQNDVTETVSTKNNRYVDLRQYGGKLVPRLKWPNGSGQIITIQDIYERPEKVVEWINDCIVVWIENPNINPYKIKQIIDKIELRQESWEDNEDIMTFNGSPIGMTISKNIEIDRWWEELKFKISDYICNSLSNQ